MSENPRLSRPPAGGFGAIETGANGGWTPPRSSSSGWLVVGVGVLLAFGGGVFWLGYQQLRLANYGACIGEIRIVESAVRDHYNDTGQLCPSAAPLPGPDVSLPDVVPPSVWDADPGWRCLGYHSPGKAHGRLQYERVGPDGVVLTAGNGYKRNGVPVHWVIRGRADEAQRTVVFEAMKEEPDQ